MVSLGRVFFIGLGLIGGSLAKVMQKQALADHIEAFSLNQVDVDLALADNTIDSKQSDLIKGIRQADLIILAVPTLAISDYVQIIADHQQPSAIITDVASVKGAVADMVKETLDHLPPNWVLGHPIAGSEKSGYRAAKTDLFQYHKVILTPVVDTDNTALQTVRSLWQQAKAEVEIMDIVTHDHIFAATSHLPHLLAFILVDTLQGLDMETDIFRFAAGGFRDATRIAGSNPTMWHDIMLTNDQAILSVLQKVQINLTRLSKAIADKDSATIATCFKNAKSARDHFQSLIEQPIGKN